MGNKHWIIRSISLVVALLLVQNLRITDGFTLSPASSAVALRPNKMSVVKKSVVILKESSDSSEEKDDEEMDDTKASATRLSLEEKMKAWEATDEERRAATLGGVVPERTDSFDVGLYIAFPFMIVGCLLFLAFPFLADKIDVSSVGPPPTS
jgi:hypothetical protein